MPLLLLLLPPAQMVQVPPAPSPKGMDQIQSLLNAIPEAFVQGKAKGMPGLVAQAKAGWERARPELRKTVPEPEAVFIDKQMKAMLRMKPREQAVGALGIASTLGRFQSQSPERDRLQADRAVLLAWCSADAGQWEPQPHLAEALKSGLDEARGRQPMRVIQAEEALKRLREAWGKHRVAEAKKALKDLREVLALLGKA